MSTKYVINSGGIRNNPEEGKKFFAECVKDLGNSPRVLFCIFGFGREYWETRFQESINRKPKLYPEDVNPIF